MTDHAAPARTPEQIERDIAVQREHLADTVDQLAARLDLTSRAQQRISSFRDSATTGSGTPRTEVVVAVASLAAMAAVLLLWRHRGAH